VAHLAARAVVGDGACSLATRAVGGPGLAWPSGGSGACILAVERRGGGAGGPDWRHGRPRRPRDASPSDVLLDSLSGFLDSCMD